MTPEEVKLDQGIRFEACKKDIQDALKKYEYDFDTTFETAGLKIATQIRFIDLKKYEVKDDGQDVAQEEVKTPYCEDIGKQSNPEPLN